MLGFQMRESGKPAGRYEFVLGAYADHDEVQPTTQDAQAGTGPAIRFRSKVDAKAGTCLYEVVMPWNRLAPFKPSAGKSFRFTWSASDADMQPGKGFNYLAWTPGINYGKNPEDFAWITLGGAAVK